MDTHLWIEVGLTEMDWNTGLVEMHCTRMLELLRAPPRSMETSLKCAIDIVFVSDEGAELLTASMRQRR